MSGAARRYQQRSCRFLLPVPSADQWIFADFRCRLSHKAALNAGAKALRIESIAYVKAVRLVTAPIIGIVKRDLEDNAVRIRRCRGC